MKYVIPFIGWRADNELLTTLSPALNGMIVSILSLNFQTNNKGAKVGVRKVHKCGNHGDCAYAICVLYDMREAQCHECNLNRRFASPNGIFCELRRVKVASRSSRSYYVPFENF